MFLIFKFWYLWFFICLIVSIWEHKFWGLPNMIFRLFIRVWLFNYYQIFYHKFWGFQKGYLCVFHYHNVQITQNTISEIQNIIFRLFMCICLSKCSNLTGNKCWSFPKMIFKLFRCVTVFMFIFCRKNVLRTSKYDF